MFKDKTKKFSCEYFYNFISISLIFTGMGSVLYQLLNNFTTFYSNEQYFEFIGLGGVFLFVFFLAYGGIVYIFSRHGYLKRLHSHVPACKTTIKSFLANEAPSLCILIPSYKEEIPVIRQSLLSSALQNYPNRRVVLLIDNPPTCPNLGITRALVEEINADLQSQHAKTLHFMNAFQQRLKSNEFSLAEEIDHLSKAYLEIADWFENQAKDYERRDHTDEMVIDLTFKKRSFDLHEKIKRLGAEIDSLTAITEEYTTISRIFRVDISSFERKQYQNLSHASNKSMNLNSYLSMLGKHVREVDSEGIKILEKCDPRVSTHNFPNAEYISVLDADSVLTYDYASRLIYEMEQPHFQKTAVIQTPYTAFPKAPGMLERIAGATTDIQYRVHQGFTYFGATFWVGANALIRKRALDDIVVNKTENNKVIAVYIQDRTVIEDTESSVDLADKGWHLYNYPERLSYSATPPDFGSLLIQRKRWANGGLIILPKVISYFFKRPFRLRRIKECFFRIHYLISIPGMILSSCLMQLSSVSLGDYPLETLLLTIPYLFHYSRDLKHSGYKHTDLFGVLSLNMMLFPVNFAGVLQSMKQIFLGKHTCFFRTPKVAGSTPVPLVYPISILCLLAFVSYTAFTTMSLADALLVILFANGVKLLGSRKFFTDALVFSIK